MARIVLIIIASLFLLMGVSVKSVNDKSKQVTTNNKPLQVLSSEEEHVEDNSVELHEDESKVQSAEVVISNTPTPKVITTEDVFDIVGYIYPGSKVLSQSEKAMVLTSNDATEKITSWYERKIQADGINVRSFVKTKTNGNVMNKLVGAKQGAEIEVTVEKKVDETSTRVEISVNK